MADPPPSGAKVLDLVKAALWPAIALIAFIDFHEPLKRTLELLPQEFERASKIQYGSLLVEIREQAKNSSFGDLSETLGALDSNSIALLLRVGPNAESIAGEDAQRNMRYIPDDATIFSFLDLESKKLVVFNNYSSARKLNNDIIPFAFIMEDIKQINTRRRNDTTDPLMAVEYNYDGNNPKMVEIGGTTFTLTEKGTAAVKAIIKAISSTINADKK